jgi:hypothetical protein
MPRDPGQCIMKKRLASEGPIKGDVAPPPLHCAVQGFAPLRWLERNNGGVCGRKEAQEGVGKTDGYSGQSGFLTEFHSCLLMSQDSSGNPPGVYRFCFGICDIAPGSRATLM